MKVSAGDRLQRLLQLFYQCPVGLVEVNEAGVVTMINPAAARMLVPLCRPEEDLREMFPCLERISPGLVGRISSDRSALGRIAAEHRIVIPGGSGRLESFELAVMRLEPDQIVMTVLDVSEERRLADREHEFALAWQESLLGHPDEVDGLEFGIATRSAGSHLGLGGDWCDVIDLPDHRIGLVVGEAAGDDVDTLHMASLLRFSVRSLARRNPDPAELLERVEEVAHHEGALCAQLTYAVLDRERRRIAYSCAGQPPPLVAGDRTTRLLDSAAGPPLCCGGAEPRVTAEDDLDPGDMLLIYSDGLLHRREDAPDTALSRLRLIGQSIAGRPPPAAAPRLIDLLIPEDPLGDDMSVLAVRYRPPAPGDNGTGRAPRGDPLPEPGRDTPGPDR